MRTQFASVAAPQAPPKVHRMEWEHAGEGHAGGPFVVLGLPARATGPEHRVRSVCKAGNHALPREGSSPREPRGGRLKVTAGRRRLGRGSAAPRSKDGPEPNATPSLSFRAAGPSPRGPSSCPRAAR